MQTDYLNGRFLLPLIQLAVSVRNALKSCSSAGRGFE